MSLGNWNKMFPVLNAKKMGDLWDYVKSSQKQPMTTGRAQTESITGRQKVKKNLQFSL